MMDDGYRSRKFFLASLFSLASVAGLFFGQLAGSEFIAMAGVVLALYGAANVTEKHVAK